MNQQILHFHNFSEALGIYVFDRNYFVPEMGYQAPFYVKDTNDFVLCQMNRELWCISRDLSLFNVVMCFNNCGDKNYCPNVQDYIKEKNIKPKYCWTEAQWPGSLQVQGFIKIKV